MNKKRFYDREFKESAVKLSNQRDDIRTLAMELGITTKLLYSWRSESRKKGRESFPGKGNMAVTGYGQKKQTKPFYCSYCSCRKYNLCLGGE